MILNRKALCRPSTKMKLYDRVEMHCYPNEVEDEFWRGKKIEFLPISRVFEGEELLLISKPPFMATHPTGRHLFHCATVQLEKEYGGRGEIFGVHRLDRETSGLLLFAKSPLVTRTLGAAFEGGGVKKCYFFIAHKEQSRNAFPFVARERLESISGRVETLCFEQGDERGKTAVTKFDIIDENESFVLGLAFPQTGRQHQIRVHAAHHGYPLLGDKIYRGGLDLFGRFKDKVATDGDCDLMEIPRHALHALGMAFPYKGEIRWVVDELPKDLLAWIEQKGDFKVTREALLQRVEASFEGAVKL